MSNKNMLKIISALLIIFIPSGQITHASQVKATKSRYTEGEVIVKYKDSNLKASNSKVMYKSYSLETKQKLDSDNLEVVKLPKGVTVDAAVQELKKDKTIESVQPNYIYHFADIPNDQYASMQWGLQDIGMDKAWNITQGSSNARIGVIDSGIDINHPDLKDNIWTNPGEIAGNGVDDDNNGYVDDINGWDFYNNDAKVFDPVNDDLHGTHVAGIIAAEINGIGTVGIAPKVKIVPLKVLGQDGGDTTDVIKAINYAKKLGIKIINCSFGGSSFDNALKDAMQNSGILFVAAAGNDGLNTDISPVYPACYNLPNIISVAAVDNKGSLADFSNYGASSIDVAAPGVNILSTIPAALTNSNNYASAYAFESGTSMAAPFVTGIAALLESKGINDIQTIKQRIMEGVTPDSQLSNNIITGGIVNAYGALEIKNINRLWGNDRYATAQAIVQSGWKTSNTVVIATGEDFPDALSAAVLAKKYNAPLLLSERDTINSALNSELAALNPKKAFIIGGYGAISKDVETQLNTKNIATTRLMGNNRYETAVSIANYLGSNGEAVIATGENFPDALSIAAYAAAKGIPILLTPKDILPSTVKDYINSHNVTKTFVVGGTGVISSALENILPNPERLSGSDRYSTNAAVLNRFSNDFNLTNVYFATGENFPDALSGSALAALTNSPIVLIGAVSNKDISDFLSLNSNKVQNEGVFGGESITPTAAIKSLIN
jgi:subtilisin family serine protease